MVSNVQQHWWQKVCKRGLDILLSLVALLLTLPLQVALLLWVWLESGRPLFYKEMRLGLVGKPFDIYKLRTLEPGTSTRSSVAADSDSRITVPGRALRRRRFDELPQLWLVLTGKMSLIGPRPLPPKHAATAQPSCLNEIQSMRPGCAGAAALDFIADDEVLAQWAEVHGDAKVEQLYLNTILPRKLAAEQAYVQNWSLLLDCQIFTRTIALLLFDIGRDASRARVKNILDQSC